MRTKPQLAEPAMLEPLPHPIDAFISYTSADEPFALALYKNLSHHRLRVWIAKRSITEPHYQVEIAAKIRETQNVVLVHSTACNKSYWVAREIAHATEHNKPVLVIKRDQAELDDALQLAVAGMQRIDAQEGLTPDTLKQLVRFILGNRACGPQGPASTPPHNGYSTRLRRLAAHAKTSRALIAIAVLLTLPFLSLPLMLNQDRKPDPTTTPTSRDPASALAIHLQDYLGKERDEQRAEIAGAKGLKQSEIFEGIRRGEASIATKMGKIQHFIQANPDAIVLYTSKNYTAVEVKFEMWVDVTETPPPGRLISEFPQGLEEERASARTVHPWVDYAARILLLAI